MSAIRTSWLRQCAHFSLTLTPVKGKGSPNSITEHRVPELIPALCSQPAGDVNHKPDGRLPLLSARPAVTPGEEMLKHATQQYQSYADVDFIRAQTALALHNYLPQLLRVVVSLIIHAGRPK